MPTATMERPNVLDEDQVEYFFTASDGGTYRQWCTTDAQAAAWAMTYKDAAESIGISLRAWGRSDGRMVRHV
jgi:hypothetical protein